MRPLESALAQPRASFDGVDLHASIAAKAAALGFSLTLNHPFVDGNKRVAHTAMEVFLILNGHEIGQAGDQRHRATVNGVWAPGAGFQVSGIYFFGSGERRWVDTGVDRRDEGGTSNTSEFRVRADGSILPRNSLVGDPIHKVDLRLQKRLPLVGRVAVDGILEVFNVFNHANYGTYVVNESNANFGQPAFGANQQYFPRVLQLGFHGTF